MAIDKLKSGALNLQDDVAMDTDTLFVDASADKVGIGITTPKRNLHIHDPAAVSTKIQITNSATGSGSDGEGFQIGVGSSGQATIEQRENQPLEFYTNNTQRMKIRDDGDVELGTLTSPAILRPVLGGGPEYALQVGVNSDNTHTGTHQIWSEYTTSSTGGNFVVNYRTAGDSGTPAARFKIDSDGNITTAFQPAFASRNSEHGNSYTGGTDITSWATPYINRGNHWNNSTGRFTAPVAGIYYFGWWVQEESYYGSWAGGVDAGFYKNGSQYMSFGQGSIADTGNEEYFHASTIIEMAANDYVTVRFECNDSTPSFESNQGAFYGYLIG